MSCGPSGSTGAATASSQTATRIPHRPVRDTVKSEVRDEQQSEDAGHRAGLVRTRPARADHAGPADTRWHSRPARQGTRLHPARDRRADRPRDDRRPGVRRGNRGADHGDRRSGVQREQRCQRHADSPGRGSSAASEGQPDPRRRRLRPASAGRRRPSVLLQAGFPTRSGRTSKRSSAKTGSVRTTRSRWHVRPGERRQSAWA